MATVVLVRHGRTTANAAGVLAGRAPGVDLDAVGVHQVETTARRLADVALARAVTSPLLRCVRTAEAIAAAQSTPPPLTRSEGLSECDYGAWQGRRLHDLVGEPLWSVVQTQASAAAFPEGESLRAMQHRAVEVIRSADADVAAQCGPSAVWLAVSHGDVIKSVLADALGTHLDQFQRISVDPASVSIIRYTAARPAVLAMNTLGGELGWLADLEPAAGPAPGGGAGPTPESSRPRLGR